MVLVSGYVFAHGIHVHTGPVDRNDCMLPRRYRAIWMGTGIRLMR